MAYGPPPAPGPGQQPPWQQPGNLWQQPQQQPQWQQQQPGSGPRQEPQRERRRPRWPRGGGSGGGSGGAPQPEHFGTVSHDEKTWALMAYVGQFLVGAIAPAIVYIGKARSPFVRRHAAQGLNMGLAAIAVWIVGGLLSLAVEVLIWLPLLFTAVVMFFLVHAARAANRGEFRRVPPAVAWPLLKK